MFASEFGGKISNIRLTALPEKKKIPNQIKKHTLASIKFAGKFTSSRSTTRHYKSVAAFLSEPN